MQRTLGLVKPDATAAGNAGEIIAAIQAKGLRVVNMKMLQWSKSQAEGFYAVHRERPFFNDLVAFMTSGPIVAIVMEGDDAIATWRGLMGPTDSTKAGPDTLRGRFGTDIEKNAVHGSDAPETAAYEIGYCFAGMELN